MAERDEAVTQDSAMLQLLRMTVESAFVCGWNAATEDAQRNGMPREDHREEALSKFMNAGQPH